MELFLWRLYETVQQSYYFSFLVLGLWNEKKSSCLKKHILFLPKLSDYPCPNSERQLFSQKYS